MHFSPFLLLLSVASLQPPSPVFARTLKPRDGAGSAGDVGSAVAAAASAAANALTFPCATIVNSGEFLFNASLVYDCLSSVPFNGAVATRFLQYWNDTLQFQSTLAYLKDPPPSYRQPPVDLLGGLNSIQEAVDRGQFHNEYEFEAALTALVYASHDGHLALFAGVLAAFNFVSPYDIVSVSVDGIAPPAVYLANDLFDSKQFTTYQPSPIATINGFDATAYLSDFAAKNAVGSLEAHAEWNQLMLSPVLDILGSLDVFSGAATFNPGDELILKFQNGTELKTRWLAFYNSQGATGPLQTGGDFYNYFVLGLLPASYDASAPNGDPGLATVSTSEATPTPTVASTSTAATTTPTVTPGWNNSAFPAVPDVAQADLGTFGGGFVSGYFYHTDSLGVLSIPSFEAKGNELDTFKAAIAEFVTKSKAAGLKRVLIDVQQNTGGNAFLAYDTFRHFFPNIDPFDGSRMRAHDSGNVMGEALTGYWNGLNDTEDDYYSLAANEWVATSRINVETGRNFTSWAEFYGPHAERGDFATTTARYNLSSSIFSESGTRTDDFTVYAYPDDPAAGVATPPYAAEDILILSDGICDSACALLVEMLHHEAGVRTVAVGGLPAPGPMQVPGGSRGARYYSISTLDDNIAAVQSFLRSQGSANATFLPNRTEALNIELLYASVNLRDQIRRGETVPVQFAYEAADCRVYYTPRTVYNQTALWLDAAAALWSSPQRCVAGSTGFATTGTAATDFVGPASAVAPSRAGVFNLTAHLDPARPAVPDGGDGVLACGGLRPCNSAEVERCNADQDCGPNRACRPFDACQGGGQVAPVKQCVPTCKANLISCPGGATCQLQQGTCVKVGSQNACDGICVPPPVQQRCGPGKVQGKVVLSPAPPVKRRDAGR